MDSTFDPTFDPTASRGQPMTRAAAPPAVDFARYAEVARGKIEIALASWLTSKAKETAALTPEARAPIEAAFDLARRGGKRLRAVLAGCTYEGFRGEGGADAVLMAGVALELLQVYLLIHDDWMDGDELRRGGPSVPAMMRAQFSSRDLADASAILAGDYAAGLALDALLSVPCAPGRVAKAAHELARVMQDVVAGQLLDVHASHESARLLTERQADVECMHALKTASYTVRAPVLIGARLAGASDPTCRVLEAFAEPLGVAFQLRDDVLGTFGDPRATGKPAWSDLRQGKRTALVAAAAEDAEAASFLRVLGDADAEVAELEALATYLTRSGVRARVEARIDALLSEARAALDSPLVPETARLVLEGSIVALGRRER
jgi:geranylgeranyl diphosphate synthase type I